jgi:hypothetical protein
MHLSAQHGRALTTALLCVAQRFSLLGSTGSIGTQTLDIVREQPEKFEIVALAAGGNLELLADQARGGLCRRGQESEPMSHP